MKLKKLLSLLIFYHHNLRILHWKVTGCHFDEYHELAAEYYNHMQLDIDSVAEMLISINEDPVTLTEAISILDKDKKDYFSLDADVNYTEAKVIEYTTEMFKDILSLIEEIINSEKNIAIRVNLENMYSYYDLECNYKNKRRKK